MRKLHLSTTLGLLVALYAFPVHVAAKPQPSRASSPTVRAPAHAATQPAPAEHENAKSRTTGKARNKSACLAKEVKVVRQHGEDLEVRTLALTDCEGRARAPALDSLSVLGRPRALSRPSLAEIRAYRRRPTKRGPSAERRDPALLVPGVLRLHEGLAERLQKVAAHFPGKTLEIVSGYRPEARETSRHHHGQALDFRVQGVSREKLRDLLRTLPDTGVGYYPNSSFVHMDVREGKGYWVDRSGPGEPADYGTWPPSRREIDQTRQAVLAGVLSELQALQVSASPAEGQALVPGPSARETNVPRSETPGAATRKTSRVAPTPADEAGDVLSDREIKRIRAEALRALEALY